MPLSRRLIIASNQKSKIEENMERNIIGIAVTWCNPFQMFPEISCIRSKCNLSSFTFKRRRSS
jgi:hypothetical protein